MCCWDHLPPEISFVSHCTQSANRTDKLQSAGIQITALITAHTHHFQRAALWTHTNAKIHTLTHKHLLLLVEMGKLTPGQCVENRWCSKIEIVQCVLLRLLESNVHIVYLCTQTHTHTQKNCLLTVEPNIMVGQDSWLVALGSPADHHVQHPIRGFNVMFLQQQQQKTISANSWRRSRTDLSQ